MPATIYVNIYLGHFFLLSFMSYWLNCDVNVSSTHFHVSLGNLSKIAVVALVKPPGDLTTFVTSLLQSLEHIVRSSTNMRWRHRYLVTWCSLTGVFIHWYYILIKHDRKCTHIADQSKYRWSLILIKVTSSDAVINIKTQIYYHGVVLG